MQEVKVLAEQYQRIQSKDLKHNKYLVMADQYAKNRLPFLINAMLIGAWGKYLNLGYGFLLIYKLNNSKLLILEIYVEAFSMNFVIISQEWLAFNSGFLEIKDSPDIESLIKTIANKASISFSGQYTISSLFSKDIIDGKLYEMEVTINGVTYYGLIYVSKLSGEVSLMVWKIKPVQDGC